MSEPVARKLTKWPFLLSDLCLLALAGFVVYFSPRPLGTWQIGLTFAAVALGGWFCIVPFLREYQAVTRMAEADALSTALGQLQNLERVRNQINSATSQWDLAQEQAAKTVAAAKDISGRMDAELKEFRTFLERANETEKAHLRLEVEKLRRGEGEWLQVTVRMLDHVYALNRAAAHSGQPALISELGLFQRACRDTARRMGLVPIVPESGAAFDGKLFQCQEGQAEPPANGRIRDTLASGYSFRGQIVRKAIVVLGPEPQPELPLILNAGSSSEEARESVPVESLASANVQEDEVVLSPTKA